jgi:hypothetical protein
MKLGEAMYKAQQAERPGGRRPARPAARPGGANEAKEREGRRRRVRGRHRQEQEDGLRLTGATDKEHGLPREREADLLGRQVGAA